VRVVVFGANGPTGRELVSQALAADHEVTSVTRHPEQVPAQERLAVIGANALDPNAVSAAIAGCDAVVSALGAPRTRKPVTLYSAGMANIIEAMNSHHVRRLVVTGTAAVDTGYHASDSLFFTRVMEPLFMRMPGKTVYADNRRMEDLIMASSLEWTIIRACWLFDACGVSDYQVVEGTPRAMFTARPDLAACLLAQLSDSRNARGMAAVVTTTGTPDLIRQIWREGIRKEKKPVSVARGQRG
jgi:putative NADH-flavin reductase